MRELIRQHLTDTQWAEAARAGAALIQFLVVARALGAESFGSLAVLLFVVSIGYAVLPGPIGMTATRRVSAGEGPWNVLTTSLVRLVPVALIGIVATIVIGELVLDVPIAAVAVMATTELLVVGAVHVCSAIRQGLLEFRPYLWIVGTSSVARVAAASILLTALPHTLTAWALVYGATASVGAIIVLIVTTRGVRHHPPTPRAKGPSGEQWVFGLNALAVRVVDDADKAILAWFDSYTAAGVYTAGYRVASYVLVPVRGVLSRTMPRMFALGAAGQDDELWALLRSTRRQLVVVCLASAPVLVVGAVLLPFLVGPDYADGTVIALALVPALALRGFHYALGDLLTAAGRVRVRLAGQLISVALPVAAYLLLIPTLGVAGAVVGTAIGEVATLVVMYRLARREIPRQSVVAR